jgi:crossover junction endonuclease EME1
LFSFYICLAQEEKLEREAKKAEAQEMKKLEKEKKKWEKGKLALKSIIAEIDPKVIQDGKLGGWLHHKKRG